jgi:hypothetical protein
MMKIQLLTEDQYNVKIKMAAEKAAAQQKPWSDSAAGPAAGMARRAPAA